MSVASKDYSGTPLSQKLGAKPGAGVVVFFATRRDDLERRFSGLKATLDSADGLWIAWPKKASGVVSDVDEGVVRATGLATGLVDYKVCAINETWSGLKFARRREGGEAGRRGGGKRT